MPFPKGVSGNPNGAKTGPRGRQLASLLRDALNAPQYSDDPKKVIADRAVEALMTGHISFERTRMVNGKLKRVIWHQKVNPKNWIDLYKFVNNHLDGSAKIQLMGDVDIDDKPFTLPADIIAPSFMDAYRDIVKKQHTEYLFFGGRGSTKSSFISLAIIYLLKNNPTMHAVAMRQFEKYLLDSVYNQLVWAINELGLSDEFHCTKSPIQITYIPTGQKIFFRGADDPMKIKSIKPQFGAISILWFEELDSFHGESVVRNITQSVIRGTDDAYIFKSYNPPRTAVNWVNKYSLVPKESQYKHESNYLDVPVEWLGQIFIDEAEHLKSVNEIAYRHEYLGEIVGTGDQVFENLQIRQITDEEIKEFDNVLHGLDWGYFPHPAHYARVHYDATRHILYIFGEVRKWKTSNEDLYQALIDYGYSPQDLIICDSEDPKSKDDFKAYGATIRGAEKGGGSVSYSMKWLQSLALIVIDPIRAPYSVEELTDYAYERTKDDEIIEAYPRIKDDAIAATRYATNLIWRRRGE